MDNPSMKRYRIFGGDLEFIAGVQWDDNLSRDDNILLKARKAGELAETCQERSVGFAVYNWSGHGYDLWLL